MSLPVYDSVVPPLLRNLANLQTIIDKGADWARAKAVDDSVMLGLRIYPDMFPFSRQVQITCDLSVRGASRLACVEIPSYPDTETTFAELGGRIAIASDFLKSLQPAAFEGAEGRTIELMAGGTPMTFSGADFIRGFIFPNVYFHASMAYALLRHVGVDVGKMDFLGRA